MNEETVVAQNLISLHDLGSPARPICIALHVCNPYLTEEE